MRRLAVSVAIASLAGCAAPVDQEAPPDREYYGTLEPFASE